MYGSYALQERPTAEQQQINKDTEKFSDEIRRLHEAHNKLAPISVLPPELLTRAFVILRRMYPVSFENSLNSVGWLGITRVCRRWREIALNCPHLWAFVSLEDSSRSVRLANEMLKKSRMAPLTVKGQFYDTNAPLVEHITKQYFPRIQVLDIFCDRHRVEKFYHSFLAHLSTPSLKLESLRLGLGRGIHGPDDEDRFQVKLPDGMISQAPRLHEVDLTAIGVPWASLSLCTCLCSLKLDDVYPRPSLSQVLDVLRATSRLQVLSLTRSLPDQRTQSNVLSAVRLEHLQTLSLEGHLHDCTLLLVLLQHPSTTRLKCRCIAKGGVAVELNHIQNIVTIIADKLQDTSLQSSSSVTIQSARLSDSSARGMDIYLFSQPLQLTRKTLPLIPTSQDTPVVISFDSSFPWKSCAHAIKCFFTSFDLSHLYSIDIQCGSYKLPEAEVLCATCGYLPHLEEIKTHDHLRGALKDALLYRSERPVQVEGTTSDSVPSPSATYFAALKTFVFENGDFGYRKNAETVDNLEKILRFRHSQGLPIRRLVLNKNKRLREWRLGEFLRYALSAEVDGEIVERADLEWDTAEETEYSDEVAEDWDEESYYSSDS